MLRVMFLRFADGPEVTIDLPVLARILKVDWDAGSAVLHVLADSAAPTRPCRLLVVEAEAEIVGATLQRDGEVVYKDGSRLAYFGSFLDSMDATFHVFEKYPGRPAPPAPLALTDEPWPEEDRPC
jgi:hypothetical protein